jgi:fructokinase
MTSNKPELGRDELPGGIEGPSVVAVAGEALIDLVPTGREGLFEAVPGGSPANVAVRLARLGVPARLLARIAADPLGRRIRNHLAGNGVDLSWAVKAGKPTSPAIVAVDPDGSPEYDFRVEGTADWQWRDAELTGVLDDQVVALHGGSLAFAMPPARTHLAGCSSAQGAPPPCPTTPTAVHCSWAPPRPSATASRGWSRWPTSSRSAPRTSRGCCRVDRRSRSPGGGSPRAPRLWRSPSGPGGMMAAGGAGIVRRPGRRVAIVDTVGAEDSFMSAPLAGLHRRGLLGVDRRAHLGAVDTDTLSAVLDEAVLASAITYTRHGANPPTAQHLLTGIP